MCGNILPCIGIQHFKLLDSLIQTSHVEKNSWIPVYGITLNQFIQNLLAKTGSYVKQTLEK